MNAKKLIATALLTLVTVHVHAGNPSLENVRPVITINGAKDRNTLTPDASSATMVVANQKFGPETERPFVIRANGKMTTAAIWTEYTLTFTPEKTGYLWLSLSGEYPPKEEPSLVFKVDIDKITVTGGKLENGDFEVRTEDGKPKFWLFAPGKEVIPAGNQLARSGSNFVTVTAQSTVGAGLAVTAGQPVTITFSARAHSE